jgi:pilus assembly protein CpaB
VAKTATLEVTPKQAEIISVVSDVGKLSLSLRSLGHDDAESAAETGNASLSYTFDSDATHLTRPPTLGNASRKVIVVRGDKVSETEFH